MNTKLFTSFLLTLVLALSLVSAVSITLPGSLTLTQSATSGTITITTNDLANLSVTSYPTGYLQVTNPTVMNNAKSFTFNVTALQIPSQSGSSTTAYINITAVNATNATDTQTSTYSLTIKNTTTPLQCSSNPGNLVISDSEFNIIGFGDEDEELFYPLDEVEYSFNVENTGNYDIENIEITACLWDVSEAKCILKESKMDIDNDDFDLDSGDDIDVKISFQIDPSKLSDNNDYVIYVAAKGEVNDKDAPDSIDGNTTCHSGYDNMEIRTDDAFVILSNIVVPDALSCTSNFEITADVWNVNNEDLDKDEVNILAINRDLGINQKFFLSDDLDSLDKQSLSFIFAPTIKPVANKTYAIEFSIYSDDDFSDNDIYENQEDDEARFIALVKFDQCTPAETKTATITAEFSASTPKAVIGSQTIIEATIKNTGNAAATYTISLAGTSAWATSTIDPQTITLNAGDSKKVNLYLDINSDALEEDKEFTITATSGAYSVSQKVQVTLEKGITASRIINHLKTNWVIYTIILVNLILIIAIILVVRSLIRK
jgi:hypothetical protein